jgi:hypothetical protein
LRNFLIVALLVSAAAVIIEVAFGHLTGAGETVLRSACTVGTVFGFLRSFSSDSEQAQLASAPA